MKHVKRMYHIFTASAIGIMFFFLGFSTFIKARFSIEYDLFIFFLPMLLSIVIFLAYKVISRVNKPPVADPDKSSLHFLFYANTPIFGLLLGVFFFFADATGFSNLTKILLIFIASLALTIILFYINRLFLRKAIKWISIVYFASLVLITIGLYHIPFISKLLELPEKEEVFIYLSVFVIYFCSVILCLIFPSQKKKESEEDVVNNTADTNSPQSTFRSAIFGIFIFLLFFLSKTATIFAASMLPASIFKPYLLFYLSAILFCLGCFIAFSLANYLDKWYSHL